MTIISVWVFGVPYITDFTVYGAWTWSSMYLQMPQHISIYPRLAISRHYLRESWNNLLKVSLANSASWYVGDQTMASGCCQISSPNFVAIYWFCPNCTFCWCNPYVLQHVIYDLNFTNAGVADVIEVTTICYASVIIPQAYAIVGRETFDYVSHSYSTTGQLSGCLLFRYSNPCKAWKLARQFRESLQWHHNGHHGVSNDQPHDCLPNRLFRHRSKKTLKLRITGVCAGNSPGTGEFPAQ